MSRLLENDFVYSGNSKSLGHFLFRSFIIEHNYLVEDQNVLPNLIDVFKNLGSHIKINVEVKSPFASDLRTARALSKVMKYIPINRIIISYKISILKKNNFYSFYR